MVEDKLDKQIKEKEVAARKSLTEKKIRVEKAKRYKLKKEGK